MNFEMIVLKLQPFASDTVQRLTKKTKKIARQSYDDSRWSNGTLGQIYHILDLQQKNSYCKEFCMDFKRAFAALDKSSRFLLYTTYLIDCRRDLVRRHFGYSPKKFNAELAHARKRFATELSCRKLDARWLGRTMGAYFGLTKLNPQTKPQEKILCNQVLGKLLAAL